ncbi:MAG: hypothetical protein IJ815_02270 [Lachnospiraceae bacterium]|uniref:hypothetical protein n=1 Tax=Butyrivibrio sp. TaxID=28121 RepID=UPI001B1F3FD5|nr:hypothetical protein [Butyrivibrio sp.]MBO6242201.1 hypothetical protein [Butyrivibrio sp.]MBR1892342.1 hypothetical protein [Lachnospiraceae bacterium]
MILKGQVTPYEFPTDSNGKRVASKEKLPYYIYFHDVGINTPDNIDEIVQRLEELRESA